MGIGLLQIFASIGLYVMFVNIALQLTADHIGIAGTSQRGATDGCPQRLCGGTEGADIDRFSAAAPLRRESCQ